jgi:hypothetical protein
MSEKLSGWRGSEMLAGMIRSLEAARHRDIEPTRAGSPPQNHLDIFGWLCLDSELPGALRIGSILEQFDCVAPSQSLGVLRQSASRLRVQPGPVTACGGRNSSGEATSHLGAVNSQSCLHDAKRPTMTAYRYCAGIDCSRSLCFCSLGIKHRVLGATTKANAKTRK